MGGHHMAARKQIHLNLSRPVNGAPSCCVEPPSPLLAHLEEITMNKIAAALIAATFSLGAFAQTAAPAAAPAAPAAATAPATTAAAPAKAAKKATKHAKHSKHAKKAKAA